MDKDEAIKRALLTNEGQEMLKEVMVEAMDMYLDVQRTPALVSFKMLKVPHDR